MTLFSMRQAMRNDDVVAHIGGLRLPGNASRIFLCANWPAKQGKPGGLPYRHTHCAQHSLPGNLPLPGNAPANCRRLYNPACLRALSWGVAAL